MVKHEKGEKNKTAERVGFEPTVTITGYNGFRDRPDRPLRHLSVCRVLYIENRRSVGEFLPVILILATDEHR